MTCIIQVNSTKYDMSKLPQLLRLLRAKSGLKNYEIAEKMGLHQATISGHLSDTQAHKPDLETLIKYSEIFNEPLESFIQAIKEDDEKEETEHLEEKNESVIYNNELSELYSKLDNEQRAILIRLLRHMGKDALRTFFDFIQIFLKEKQHME